MTPVAWAKAQPWWPAAHAVAALNQLVVIHVPEWPFEGTAFLRLHGKVGRILVRRCTTDHWHIAATTPMVHADLVEKLEHQVSQAHPTVMPAVGEA